MKVVKIKLNDSKKMRIQIVNDEGVMKEIHFLY